MLRHVWDKFLFKLLGTRKQVNLTDYWKNRAYRYGKHSVLNLAHSEDQFDTVTNFQKSLLFPLLNNELIGTEKVVLDFGCGPGRFTCGLSELIGGKAVGVDITSTLLNIAPRSPNVQYQCIKPNYLPFPDSFFDIVWSCLVLGGISEDDIYKSISEINRVLCPGGLFFYIENTAKVSDSKYWFYRDESSYIQLGSFCKPRVIGYYKDSGQIISIFAGRKC